MSEKEQKTPNAIIRPEDRILELEEELAAAQASNKYISTRLNTLSQMLEEVGCTIVYPIGLDFEVINDKGDMYQEKYEQLLKLIRMKMPEGSLKAEIIGEITDESK